MKHLNTFVIYPYLPILIGALMGAALGYFGQCSSGTCPLTSTWWRGAIYGGVLGTLFFFSGRGQSAAMGPSNSTPEVKTNQERSLDN